MTELSDAVIMAHLEAIRAELAHQTADLAEVKAEVKKTNGRVTVLELWQARLAGAAGAMAWRPGVVLAFLVAAFSAIAAVIAAHFIG